MLAIRDMVFGAEFTAYFQDRASRKPTKRGCNLEANEGAAYVGGRVLHPAPEAAYQASTGA